MQYLKVCAFLCYPAFCVNSLTHEPSDEGSLFVLLQRKLYFQRTVQKVEKGQLYREEPEKHYTSAK